MSGCRFRSGLSDRRNGARRQRPQRACGPDAARRPPRSAPSISVGPSRAPSPHARSSCCRPSPTRPSSPSRTCGCSRRCRRARPSSTKRCSSRPQRPTCSRSSAARLSTFRRCLIRWSNPLPDSAMPTRVDIFRPFDGAFRSWRSYGYSPGFLRIHGGHTRSGCRAWIGCRPGRSGTQNGAHTRCPGRPGLRHEEYRAGGRFRTVLAVPLLREGEPDRRLRHDAGRARPSPKEQIELVETFADQAVIAIENVRLFEEVQAKTRDLEESLTFQKATSGVLEVISRSASDLQPVLDVILDTAADLCHADMSVLRLMRDGDSAACGVQSAQRSGSRAACAREPDPACRPVICCRPGRARGAHHPYPGRCPGRGIHLLPDPRQPR